MATGKEGKYNRDVYDFMLFVAAYRNYVLIIPLKA